MKKVNWFAIGFISAFIPGCGYFIMGNYVRGALVVWAVVLAIVFGRDLIPFVMLFSALMQLNQAFVHNRAINDSKTEELLYELRKANRIRNSNDS